MQQHPGRRLPSLILLMLLFVSTAWCQSDSAGLHDGPERTLFIGSVNVDCVPDTVRGSRTATGGYLPKRILWGQPRPDQIENPDTACAGRTPRRKRVRQTVITYPGWNITGGSAAFQRINQDMTADIVLHIRGRINKHGIESDTLRSLVIFSQHGLDSLHVIHVGDIGRFTARPFYAMELVIGSELTAPAARDLSGDISYVLEPIDLEIEGGDSTLPPPVAHPTITPLATVESDYQASRIQVYPNPASTALSIEAAGLGEGAYLLQLISVNGTVAVREELNLTPGENLHHTLDVQHIPNGYYVVRIERGTSSPGSTDASTGDGSAGDGSAGDVIATYPIIITR